MERPDYRSLPTPGLTAVKEMNKDARRRERELHGDGYGLGYCGLYSMSSREKKASYYYAVEDLSPVRSSGIDFNGDVIDIDHVKYLLSIEGDIDKIKALIVATAESYNGLVVALEEKVSALDNARALESKAKRNEDRLRDAIREYAQDIENIAESAGRVSRLIEVDEY